MKTKILILLLLCFAFINLKAQTLTPSPNANLIYTNIFAEKIKIGGGTTPISSSALLELNSTNKGLLLPRMTDAQMSSIVNPVKGLIIYNTDNNCLYVKNTTSWVNTCANLSQVEISWNGITNKPLVITNIQTELDNKLNISSATSTYATISNLNLKANVASPTFTGTVSGITKSMVGLANVDNTTDLLKPISTATSTALADKVDKATGERLINATEITKLANQSGTNTGDQDLSSFATNTNLALKANIASPAFTGTVSGIDKSMVGLANVDNTTDLLKPVSTATQTALNNKENSLGNPSVSGYILSSSTSGVRTWVAASSSSGTSWGLIAGTLSSQTDLQTALDLKLSTSSAASTYLSINNPTATGTLTAPTIANSLGANFATTSGKVGIGTISPQNLLHVKGTAAVGVGVRNSHFIIESAETAAVDVGAILKFAGQSGNTVNPYSFGTIEAKKESALTNNYSSYLAFHTVDNTGGSTERMRINGSGNVGIGTTGALYKLHVLGGNIYVGGAGAGIRIEDRSLATRSFQLYVDGGAFAFFNHNNSTQPLTVTDGGNVLVGTVTNSGYKLDVNGTARVTGTTQMNGNVGIGTAPSTQSLNVFSNTNDIAFQAANAKTTGSNYAVAGTATGAGATLNMGGYFYADGATTNHGIRVYNITAAANNYALFIDSPAKSYFQSNIGIGTTTPAASAVLDITSTTQGVLFPRLTTDQINAIVSPANGLTVYNTELSTLCFYHINVWKKVSHSNM